MLLSDEGVVPGFSVCFSTFSDFSPFSGPAKCLFLCDADDETRNEENLLLSGFCLPDIFSSTAGSNFASIPLGREKLFLVVNSGLVPSPENDAYLLGNFKGEA